ncbi:MAG: glycoside hydrolase family 3 C-terminal domain-containing protein [Oscillospiraceae bacterium]|jgi:beta-glucosidase|nr:glycoside hydrolase family 3 C-terminal domain-containing protein [Oscillospiraceae bacterium]
MQKNLENIRALVAKLTLQEKAQMVTGKDFWHTLDVERLDIPSIMVSDGPHGLRKQSDKADHLGINDSIKAVCFPTAAGTASSFDRALLRRLGETLGEECRREALGVLLGPAVNIKRSPLCGRNFEYFSEDPYLAGELAVSYTNGVQSKQVGVSIKHFAANNQEKRRMTVRSVADERTLREIYFPAFEQTVKRADPWTVMCAYNRLFEGLYCSENKRLLTDILRHEWGFAGAVISDWGAVSNRVKGLPAGLDLEMPGSGQFNTGKLIAAVESGEMEESALDAACERILTLVAKVAARLAAEEAEVPAVDWDAEHEKARAVARETMVLLKNDGVLPLKKTQKVAFLGGFAQQPRFQGGGSSHINSYRVTSALEAASQLEGADVSYAEGFRVTDYEYDPVLTQQAVSLAKESDVAVIFAGLPETMESEGADRRHLDLPPCQNELIRAVAKVQPNVVVVLHNGSPVILPWLDEVSAVLESHLGGEAVGGAQVDLLFGAQSPCGKLAETFPLRLQDTPCYENFPGNPLTVEYREGIYVGYRYYDKAEKTVQFPFGYGLTYTTFAYSDLTLSAESITPDDTLDVALTVTNTGDFDAAEIVQIYVAAPDSAVFRAPKELKGFAKIFLKAGESGTVTVTLDARSFSYYHTGLGDWAVENGNYQILAAASSRDVRLAASVAVEGAPDVAAPYEGLALPHYESGAVHDIPAAEFEALLGFPLPAAHLPENSRIHLGSTLEEAQTSKWGRRILAAAKLVMKLGASKMGDIGGEEVLLSGVTEMPLRSMAAMSQGLLTEAMGEAIVSILNDEHLLRSLGTLFLGGVQAVKKVICDK